MGSPFTSHESHSQPSSVARQVPTILTMHLSATNVPSQGDCWSVHLGIEGWTVLAERQSLIKDGE